MSFVLIVTIISLMFPSCTGSEEKQLSEKQILIDFSKFNQVSQDFFNSNARAQCACLGQFQPELKKMLDKSKTLMRQLVSDKATKNDSLIEKEIENQILPVIVKYNSCLPEERIAPEIFEKVEEDLKSFAGASAPGGKSDKKMRRLSVVLLKKHCNDLYEIGFNLDRLTFLISPGQTK